MRKCFKLVLLALCVTILCVTSVQAVDTTPPVVTINTAEILKYPSATTVTFTGTAVDAESGVTAGSITVDGNPVSISSYNPTTGVWTANWTCMLTSGSMQVQVCGRATDGVGNTSAWICETITITVRNPQIIYVKPHLGGTHDGASWDTAFDSIQAAINYAWGGDQIWVAAGTYNENVTVDESVTIYGGFTGSESDLSDRPPFPRRVYPDPSLDPYETIINGSGGSDAVTISTVTHGSLILIDGFSIQGGGRGLYYSSLNRAIYIINCKIRNNSGGGGVWLSGHPSFGYWPVTIENCEITGNSGYGYTGKGAVYVAGCLLTVTNSLIANNFALYGFGGIECSSCPSANIINNTIVSNSSVHNPNSAGIRIYGLAGSQATIANCIVASNTSTGINVSSQGTVALRNNDVWGSSHNYVGITPDATNISADPLFETGSYHLSSGSPCIDKGCDIDVDEGWTDIDGEPRQVDIPNVGITDVKVDIGVDEYYPDYENEPVVDLGIENISQNLNNAAGANRCNIRWADFSTNIFYGDDFKLLAGPNWAVDTITVWAVPEIPVSGYALADHYSNIKLFVGAAGGSLTNLVSGNFTTGSSTDNSAHITITPVTYGDTGSSIYQTFCGQYRPIWRIDFINLNWQISGGTKYVFGVYATPHVDRNWFMHAMNTSQAGADGTVYQINSTGSVISTSVSGTGWFGKGSDINVKVHAHPVGQ